MNRPLPRDPSEMTAAEGQAVEHAYANRREAVKEKTKEIATKPIEILYILDDQRVADMVAGLMRAYYSDGDLLNEALNLCTVIAFKAWRAADIEIPDVDDEKILEEMRGDHE